MIKRIELINFMSHQHTVIEPSSGLTVLIGPNNCGKSAIVTALQILCNNPKSTYVLRHGAKQCKIIVETNTGDVIQWSRKKNGSPKYTINGEPFDRLNGKVPPELHAILRMPQVQVDKESFDVHFGEQTTPLFLLGDKEKAAAQFFASSSDAIRLVEMQDRHKSNIKLRKSDLKRVKNQRESLIADNVVLTPVIKLHDKAIKCKALAGQIEAEKQQLIKLQQVVTTIYHAQQRSHLLNQQAAVLKVIPALPTLTPTANIAATIAAVIATDRDVKLAQSKLDALQSLTPPPELAATDRLSQWVKDWHRNDRAKRFSDQQLESLSTLQRPPEIQSTATLQKTIGDLFTQQRLQQSFERRAQVLDELPEVPQLASTSAITELIARYSELLTRQAQQTNQAKTAAAKIAGVEHEIEQWLEENPQCPTCGAEISKQQLLEKPGGHLHG